MISKLMELISDPSAKEKLSGAVSGIMSDPPEGSSLPLAQNSPSNPLDLFSGDNMQLMLKIKHMLEKLNSKDDSRIGLLDSMKPFVRSSRSKSIDAAIRFIQILNFAKENKKL